MGSAFVFLLIISLSISTTATNSSLPIRHFIFLMLENRSFDHMLGFLKQANQDINGLTGSESCPVDPNDSSKGSVTVSPDSPYITDPDPAHTLDNVTEQIYGTSPTPSMTGFVYNYEKLAPGNGQKIMKCFSPNSIPALASLAQEFAIFDGWFSSVPGPTFPNRLFFFGATSLGNTDLDRNKLVAGYPVKTIFERLKQHGRDFRVYVGDLPSVLYIREMRKPDNVARLRRLENFFADAMIGNLPDFTFIEPRYYNTALFRQQDEHPPSDIRFGEYLIADIYHAIRNSPIWEESLLVILHDEHGGLYDHVPPPEGVPAPDDSVPTNPEDFDFTRLGVRVPCVMVSPWIERGTVVHAPDDSSTYFDHTSMIATLTKYWSLGTPFTQRDAHAATFESVWQGRDTPRTDCPTALPCPDACEKMGHYCAGVAVPTPLGIAELLCSFSSPMSSALITAEQNAMLSIYSPLGGFCRNIHSSEMAGDFARAAFPFLQWLYV